VRVELKKEPVADNAVEAVLNVYAGTYATISFGGTAKNQKKISLDGSPGRAFDVELPEGKGTIKYRVILCKDRVFTLEVGPCPKIAQADVEKFLDLFKPLKK
jgi:uncharacterized membrane protein YkoI